MIARQLLKFLWKDWVQARSYRTGFLLDIASLLLPMIGLFFLGRVFDGATIPAIARYGGDYLGFALLGLVMTAYSLTALRAFSTSLRAAQMTGTLEVLLMTRASLSTVIIGWSLYPFARATFQMLALLLAGFLFLGLHLENANLAGAVLVIILSIVVMGGLGILAASFTLVFKQGEPFTGVIVGAAGILSGTLYPVSVLPDWLQFAAKLLPQTHTIEGMRLAVLQGYSIPELAPQIGALLGFSAILPVALVVFRYALVRARAEGSLAHY